MDAVAGADGYHKPAFLFCLTLSFLILGTATFNFLLEVSHSVERNQFLILAIAVSVALAMLLVGVYLFASSNTSQFSGGMMGPTPTPTSGNSNQVIAVILIAVAAIALVVAVLYLAYSKSIKAPRIETRQVYPKETVPLSPQQTASKEEAKPFQVFLCYKKSSGKDYADHLKTGLEEVGIHTFEDCKDIPQTVDTEEGWARFRDNALAESKFFLLIMTPGFDLSSEVVKEIGMARKQANKTFVFFRHRSMSRKIVVNLGDEMLDIGKLEQVSFESKEELLRLAINILSKDKAQ